jgi:hypothetical protein
MVMTASARVFKRYATLNFVSLEEVVANAGQTAIIAPEPVLLAALERAGLHLKVRFTRPQQVFYLE